MKLEPERVYIIGSLRQERARQIGSILRADGHDVFDDWHGAGPAADEEWMAYEKARGRTYLEALYEGKLADHSFEFDRKWILWSTVGVLVLPAGKSGHLELGWVLGSGRRGYILLEDEEPERWDLMYLFAHKVCPNIEALRKVI